MLIFTSLSWINNFEARNIFSKYLRFRSTAATHIDFTLISRLLITIHTKVTFIIFFKAVKFLTIARRIVKFTLNLSALSDQLKSFHCFYGQSIPKYFLLVFNLPFSFFLNSPELIFFHSEWSQQISTSADEKREKLDIHTSMCLRQRFEMN